MVVQEPPIEPPGGRQAELGDTSRREKYAAQEARWRCAAPFVSGLIAAME